MASFDDSLDLRAPQAPSRGHGASDPFTQYENLKRDMGVARETASLTNRSRSNWESERKRFVEEEVEPYLTDLDPLSVQGDDPSAWFGSVDQTFEGHKAALGDTGLFGGRTDESTASEEWVNTHEKKYRLMRERFARLEQERNKALEADLQAKSREDYMIRHRTSIPDAVIGEIEQLNEERQALGSTPLKPADMDKFLDGMSFEKPAYNAFGNLTNLDKVDPRSYESLQSTPNTSFAKRRRSPLVDRGIVKDPVTGEVLNKRQVASASKREEAAKTGDRRLFFDSLREGILNDRLKAKGYMMSENGLYNGRPYQLSEGERSVLDVEKALELGLGEYKGKPIEEAFEALGGEESAKAARVLENVYVAENARIEAMVAFMVKQTDDNRKKMELASSVANKTKEAAAAAGFGGTMMNRVETPVHSDGALGDFASDIKRGWLTYEMSDLTPDLMQGSVSESTIKKFIDMARQMESMPETEDMRRLMSKNPKGWGDSLLNMFQNPGALTDMFIQSMASFLPAWIEWGAKTGLAGAGTGALIGSPGGIPGAIAGTGVGTAWGVRLGAGVGSFMLEYTGKMMEELNELGVDWKNPKVLAAAFNNPEIMSKLRDKAVKKAGGVGLFDAISGGVAGKVGASLKGGPSVLFKSGEKLKEAQKGVSRAYFHQRLGNIAAEAAVGGTLGGAGDFVGQYWSNDVGESIDKTSVLSEMLLEWGPSSFGVAQEMMRSGLSTSYDDVSSAPYEWGDPQNVEGGVVKSLNLAGFRSKAFNPQNPEAMARHLAGKAGIDLDSDQGLAFRQWSASIFQAATDGVNVDPSQIHIAFAPRTPNKDPHNPGHFVVDDSTGNAVLFLNEKEFSKDPIGSAYHESGHLFDYFAMTQGERAELWAEVTPEERLNSFVQYFTKRFPTYESITDPKIKAKVDKQYAVWKKDERRAMGEWMTLQIARVLSGQTTELKTGTQKLVRAFLENTLQGPLEKWSGQVEEKSGDLDKVLLKKMGFDAYANRTGPAPETFEGEDGELKSVLKPMSELLKLANEDENVAAIIGDAKAELLVEEGLETGENIEDINKQHLQRTLDKRRQEQEKAEIPTAEEIDEAFAKAKVVFVQVEEDPQVETSSDAFVDVDTPGELVLHYLVHTDKDGNLLDTDGIFEELYKRFKPTGPKAVQGTVDVISSYVVEEVGVERAGSTAKAVEVTGEGAPSGRKVQALRDEEAFQKKEKDKYKKTEEEVRDSSEKLEKVDAELRELKKRKGDIEGGEDVADPALMAKLDSKIEAKKKEVGILFQQSKQHKRRLKEQAKPAKKEEADAREASTISKQTSELEEIKETSKPKTRRQRYEEKETVAETEDTGKTVETRTWAETDEEGVTTQKTSTKKQRKPGTYSTAAYTTAKRDLEIIEAEAREITELQKMLAQFTTEEGRVILKKVKGVMKKRRELVSLSPADFKKAADKVRNELKKKLGGKEPSFEAILEEMVNPGAGYMHALHGKKALDDALSSSAATSYTRNFIEDEVDKTREADMSAEERLEAQEKGQEDVDKAIVGRGADTDPRGSTDQASKRITVEIPDNEKIKFAAGRIAEKLAMNQATLELGFQRLEKNLKSLEEKRHAVEGRQEVDGKNIVNIPSDKTTSGVYTVKKPNDEGKYGETAKVNSKERLKQFGVVVVDKRGSHDKPRLAYVVGSRKPWNGKWNSKWKMGRFKKKRETKSLRVRIADRNGKLGKATTIYERSQEGIVNYKISRASLKSVGNMPSLFQPDPINPFKSAKAKEARLKDVLNKVRANAVWGNSDVKKALAQIGGDNWYLKTVLKAMGFGDPLANAFNRILKMRELKLFKGTNIQLTKDYIIEQLGKETFQDDRISDEDWAQKGEKGKENPIKTVQKEIAKARKSIFEYAVNRGPGKPAQPVFNFKTIDQREESKKLQKQIKKTESVIKLLNDFEVLLYVEDDRVDLGGHGDVSWSYVPMRMGHFEDAFLREMVTLSEEEGKALLKQDPKHSEKASDQYRLQRDEDPYKMVQDEETGEWVDEKQGLAPWTILSNGVAKEGLSEEKVNSILGKTRAIKAVVGEKELSTKEEEMIEALDDYDRLTEAMKRDPNTFYKYTRPTMGDFASGKTAGEVTIYRRTRRGNLGYRWKYSEKINGPKTLKSLLESHDPYFVGRNTKAERDSRKTSSFKSKKRKADVEGFTTENMWAALQAAVASLEPVDPRQRSRSYKYGEADSFYGKEKEETTNTGIIYNKLVGWIKDTEKAENDKVRLNTLQIQRAKDDGRQPPKKYERRKAVVRAEIQSLTRDQLLALELTGVKQATQALTGDTHYFDARRWRMLALMVKDWDQAVRKIEAELDPRQKEILKLYFDELMVKDRGDDLKEFRTKKNKALDDAIKGLERNEKGKATPIVDEEGDEIGGLSDSQKAQVERVIQLREARILLGGVESQRDETPRSATSSMERDIEETRVSPDSPHREADLLDILNSLRTGGLDRGSDPSSRLDPKGDYAKGFWQTSSELHGGQFEEIHNIFSSPEEIQEGEGGRRLDWGKGIGEEESAIIGKALPKNLPEGWGDPLTQEGYVYLPVQIASEEDYQKVLKAVKTQKVWLLKEWAAFRKAWNKHDLRSAKGSFKEFIEDSERWEDLIIQLRERWQLPSMVKGLSMQEDWDMSQVVNDIKTRANLHFNFIKKLKHFETARGASKRTKTIFPDKAYNVLEYLEKHYGGTVVDQWESLALEESESKLASLVSPGEGRLSGAGRGMILTPQALAQYIYENGMQSLWDKLPGMSTSKWQKGGPLMDGLVATGILDDMMADLGISKTVTTGLRKLAEKRAETKAEKEEALKAKDTNRFTSEEMTGKEAMELSEKLGQKDPESDALDLLVKSIVMDLSRKAEEGGKWRGALEGFVHQKIGFGENKKPSKFQEALGKALEAEVEKHREKTTEVKDDSWRNILEDEGIFNPWYKFEEGFEFRGQTFYTVQAAYEAHKSGEFVQGKTKRGGPVEGNLLTRTERKKEATYIFKAGGHLLSEDGKTVAKQLGEWRRVRVKNGKNVVERNEALRGQPKTRLAVTKTVPNEATQEELNAAWEAKGRGAIPLDFDQEILKAKLKAIYNQVLFLGRIEPAEVGEVVSKDSQDSRGFIKIAYEDDVFFEEQQQNETADFFDDDIKEEREAGEQVEQDITRLHDAYKDVELTEEKAEERKGYKAKHAEKLERETKSKSERIIEDVLLKQARNNLTKPNKSKRLRKGWAPGFESDPANHFADPLPEKVVSEKEFTEEEKMYVDYLKKQSEGFDGRLSPDLSAKWEASKWDMRAHFVRVAGSKGYERVEKMMQKKFKTNKTLAQVLWHPFEVKLLDQYAPIRRYTLRILETMGISKYHPMYRHIAAHEASYRYHGIGMEAMREARLKYHHKIPAVVASHGITSREFGEYMNALSMPAKNRVVERYRRNLYENAKTEEERSEYLQPKNAGLTNIDAAKAKNFFEKDPRFQAMLNSEENPVDLLLEMNMDGLDNRVANGVMTKAERDTLVHAATHDWNDGKGARYVWVPTRGWDGASEFQSSLEARDDLLKLSGKSGTGQGFSQNMRATLGSHATKGRRSSLADLQLILPHAIRMHQDSLIRSHKNTPALAFGKLVDTMQANPEMKKEFDDMFEIIEGEIITHDEAEADAWVKQFKAEKKNPLKKYSAEAGVWIVSPGGQTIFNVELAKVEEMEPGQEWKTGLVRTELKPEFGNQDEIFVWREEGRARMIKLRTVGKDGNLNLEATRLLRSLKNIGHEKSPVPVIGSITRFMAKAFTTWNPDFILRNLTRDLQTAYFNLNEDEKAEFASKVVDLKKIWKYNKAIYKSERRAFKKESAPTFDLSGMDSEAILNDPAITYQLLKKFGGKSGFFKFETMRDLTKTVESIETMMAKGKGNNKVSVAGMKKQLSNFVDVIDSMNTSVENSIRLSAFTEATRWYLENHGSGKKSFENAKKFAQSNYQDSWYAEKKYGVTREMVEAMTYAANVSRDVTVDFNKKGELSTMLSSFYVFFNPGMQGNWRMLKSLLGGRLPGEPGSAVLRTGLITKMVMFSAAFGMSSRLYAGEDEDEEGMPIFDKKNAEYRNMNVVIPNPVSEDPDENFSLPVAHGYNLFWGIGQEIASVAWKRMFPESGGGTSAMAAGFRIKDLTLNQMSPFGSGFDFVPSVASPMWDLIKNEDWLGRRIYKEDFAFGTPKPASERSKKNTLAMYDGLAKIINKWGGGSKTEAGSFNGFFGGDPLNYNPEEDVSLSFPGSGLQFIVEAYMAGPTTTAGRLVSGVGSIFNGDFAWNPDQTPIARSFYDNYESTFQPDYRYKEVRDRVMQARKTLEEAKALRDPGLVKQVMRDYGPLFKAYPLIQKTDAYLRKYRDSTPGLKKGDAKMFQLDSQRERFVKQRLVEFRKLGLNV